MVVMPNDPNVPDGPEYSQVDEVWVTPSGIVSIVFRGMELRPNKYLSVWFDEKVGIGLTITAQETVSHDAQQVWPIEGHENVKDMTGTSHKVPSIPEGVLERDGFAGLEELRQQARDDASGYKWPHAMPHDEAYGG